MRRIALVLLAFLCLTEGVRANDWTLIKYQGRDHVTLDNVAEFYGLGSVMHASNNGFSLQAPGRSLRGSRGSNEFYINNLKFILSYPVSESNGHLLVSRMDLTKVIEPVLRPSRIRNASAVDTVILDPGHGGYDNGATSPWGNEKTFALDVACRARDILEQHGFKVYMTRTSDVFIPLEERVAFANRFSNAIFISIHFNSGGNSASGLETYTLAPRGVPSMAADGPRLSDLVACPGNVCDAENMALATAAHASLVCHSQLYDRGIKRARFVVIRDITIPGVLMEGGFLSNPSDSRKIASVAYRQEMACCIAAAAQNYRSAVGDAPSLNLVAGDSAAIKNVSETVSAGQSKSNEPVVTTPTAD